MMAQAAATERRHEWHAIVRATVGDSAAPLPHVGNGANAADVRAVLMVIERRFSERLARVEAGLTERNYGVGSSLDGLEEAMWTFRHRRLNDFVQVEVAGYLRIVAPTPSVTSVFAAAAQKAQQIQQEPLVEPLPARVDIMLCNRCGSPRLEDVLYGSCAYCGEEFFPR